MWAEFEADPAGQRIPQIWEDLDAAARHCPLPLNWLESAPGWDARWNGTTFDQSGVRHRCNC